MSDTIAFYCGGRKPVLEMFLSLYSLRKHYSGNITVLLGETALKFCEPLLKKTDIEIIVVPGTDKDTRTQHHWASRWQAMKLLKHDRVLHPDCDTTTHGDLAFLFDYLHKDVETMTTLFDYNDGVDYNRWKSHLACYRHHSPSLPAEVKPLYLAFGLMGWNKGYPFFDKVTDYMRKGVPKDEMAMSLVLMENGRKGFQPVIEPRPFRLHRAYYRLTEKEFDATRMWHYPLGQIHVYYNWWTVFHAARLDNAYNVGDDEFIKFIHPDCYKMIKEKTWPNVNWKGKGVDPKHAERERLKDLEEQQLKEMRDGGAVPSGEQS